VALAVTLVPVGKFDHPVSTGAPAGDPRVFVVEQPGRVQLIQADGSVAATPFLSVPDTMYDGDERGLLSIAFPPDYASSGRFYVFVVAQPDGQLQVREYRRSATDPNRADPASMRVVLAIDHAQNANHNGGGMRFGPDGMLYVGVGDGGGSNDPTLDAHGQYSAQSLDMQLGKLLRVDVGAGTTSIFQYGLRNPWRFSFDRGTGDLLIGDVGQDAREEVDIAPAAQQRLPGANWGWPCWEGTLHNTNISPQCSPPDARFPAFERYHGRDGVSAITGGVVVRDPGVPSLAGRYLYGDLAWDHLHSLAVSGASVSDERQEDALPVSQAVSIDEDGCGRIVVSQWGGTVARVVEGAPSACPPPAPAPPGSTPTPAGPPAPAPGASAPAGCGLRARVPARRRLAALRRRGLPVSVRVLARCTVRLSAGGRARRVRLLPGERRLVRLRVPRHTRAGVLRVRVVAGTGAARVYRVRVVR
jgi:glucose/arabinose dehydrogenase